MTKYSIGPQNIITKEFQMIRLSEGWCPHNCPWCKEPTEALKKRDYDIPTIVNNIVEISDMNLLASPQAIEKIKQFKDIRVNNKVVYPWLICGIDYRFLTDEIAQALKDSRFINIHIAWDKKYKDQKLILNAINKLKKVGYKDISIFMICNHPFISYNENCNKLNLCKYWNVKVNDCWFDNQISPQIKPIAWTTNEIISFRSQVRKHNQFVRFKIDPELKLVSPKRKNQIYFE
jgi:hypothetical protein